MDTGRARDRRSTQSGSYGFSEAAWTPSSPLARTRSPSQSARLSSLAYPETFHYGLRSQSRRFSPLALPPLQEPQLLRLRPTSLRTQDISYLLTGIFRNLYTAEVIGEDVSTSLIKARGSENALHEEFVDELQQIRELYKQRLDEFEMLERHIIQACARAAAEKERAMHQAKVHDFESIIKLPPEKAIFRWCVDNELLQKHHLICPDDYYRDVMPFCSAPKGNPTPHYLKLTFSCEKRSVVAKKQLMEKHEASCRTTGPRSEDESDYTVDSLTWDSSLKAQLRTKDTVKKPSAPKNKNWMNHLRVPQRQLERLLLARMESRNQFLKNPRFFPPNTSRGGRSLVFPPRKPAPAGEFPEGEPGQSYVDTPVFLAKPPVVFFTDYEIGSVYKMVIALQNTTATSRYLRVLPPSTPYFSLGLGMFPGKGGMVAPGMTCQYTVQFFPDCLGDFDDFVVVETQSSHRLLIPLQARRPPPVLTLPPVLDCGYCLVGGKKVSRFLCKNVGFSVGKFCVMPKRSWPPPSFRAIATTGFVEQPPFGIMPSVFELAPGQAELVEVLFLPTSLGEVEQTFIVTCDNCQIKELVTSGVGQLIALDLICISGEKSQPEPGELTDLTAQYFIRFAPENLQSTARRQLIVRNATHVELAFHWQIMKPNLKFLMPGETYSVDSIQYHPDKGTAFSVTPERGMLNPHADHKFILSFSPHKFCYIKDIPSLVWPQRPPESEAQAPEGKVNSSRLKDFHSVLQLVLEDVPEPTSSDPENFSNTMDDVIVLEIEVKGSAEPFQVLLEPYALIIPGENYIGISVKKDFKMWNNSKSCIRYTWEKISDCHMAEVEPCSGTIESSEVEDFELKFTGGVPGPTSQDLLCNIRDSPWPVVLHVEATFKGPALVIDVSALQFGLLRLGQKATHSIQIQNTSPLPAMWCLKESPVCLEERHETVSPFNLEPSSGQVHPLGECRVDITLEARQCQCLQTVLVLEVVNGPWSYLPVYAEIQEPYVYLQSSHVEVSGLYQGVPATAPVTLINGTLLPTWFRWGKLLGHQASFCKAKVSPRRGTLGPGEELQLSLELTAHTQDKLTDLALPCTVSGTKKPLVLGITGKPQGVHVGIAISSEGSDRSPSAEPGPGCEEALLLDFGSTVPLRTRVNRQLVLTNRSPIQTPFTLQFEYFGSPQNSLSQKPNLSDMCPALLKTARMRQQLAKREQLDFMESMLSHGKGAAFFPHVSQGVLGAYQQLRISITGCANMWGEYWDNLICTVGDLPPSVIPVHMAVVGCPISTQRTSCIADQSQKEPVIRFNTQVSGGDTVTRVLRLNNCSPCDIRLDWETYAPEEKEDQLVELLVFYGPPFPLQDQAGNDFLSPEIPESSSSSWSPSFSHESLSSHEAAQSAESSSRANDRASQIISVVLQGHEGVPSEYLYRISPKQVVVPAGGSSTISISFIPLVLGPHILHKVECVGYALGYMSLDNEVDREVPGRMQRRQDFAVGPLRLDLHGYVRPAQLSVELDYGGGTEFRHQASDLIPEQPCSGVLSELVTTHHLKVTNTTDIPHYFRLLVSRPFSVSQDGASRSHRAPGPGRELERQGALAAAGKQLVLHPHKSMLVGVSFSLSLELLSYQRLPADQMLPGVDIQQSASGEKEMVFTQDLLLEYTNHTTQVVPLRATVAVPELQLSTSWVDFGTCFVNQEHSREVYLMNLSGSRSYWAVLMGQKQPDNGPATFRVFPSNGLLEARPVNGPPTSIALQVLFTARSTELYESTLVVEGVLGEKACTLQLRGQGSYDERFVSPYQL